MSFTPVFDIRSTLGFSSDLRPKNYREKILELGPNADAPLTAMLNMAESESVDDPEYNWFTETLSPRGGTVTEVYTDAGLADAYAAAADQAAGTMVYAKVAELLAKEFKAADQVLLRDTAHHSNDVQGKVTQVVRNGASSFIAVKLLEADGGATRYSDLSDCNYIAIKGSIHPELDGLPDIITYEPTKIKNYTQIFKRAIGMSRTAMKTKLRAFGSGAKYYARQKAKALLDHGRDMENAFIFGVPTENIGENGEPERTTAGIVWFIRQYASQNYLDFSTSTEAAFSGQDWLSAGEEFMDWMLSTVFKYGSERRIAFVGNGALLAISQLVKELGMFTFEPTTTAYGIKVVRWVTPFGEILLKRHPLFTLDDTNKYSMLIVSPENLRYRYIDDTMWLPDLNFNKGGHIHVDGKKEGFLTECGLEMHHPETFAYINGIGMNNIN